MTTNAKRVTEVRDSTGKLTHLMCCICFVYVEIEKLWKCRHGQKWDMCGACGYKEGCPCPNPASPVRDNYTSNICTGDTNCPAHGPVFHTSTYIDFGDES